MTLFGQGDFTFFALSKDANEAQPIHLCKLSAGDGHIDIIKTFSGVKNANYFSISPDQKNLLVTSSSDGLDAGGMVQFFIDAKGYLQRQGDAFSVEGAPCYVSFDVSGRYFFTANYGTGEIDVWPFASGQINEGYQTLKFEGSGPDKTRQEKPHAHYVHSDPSGKFVYAVDLGTDKVMNYVFMNGKLIPNGSQPFFKLKPGSGPRHLAFHAKEPLVYVLNELKSTVTACQLNEQTGDLKAFQTISMLPDTFSGFSKAAAIRIHPSGKFLYASNRGFHSIAVFRIDANGKLTLVELEDEEIDWPRDFQVSPDGKYVLVCNLNANDITVYEVDEKSGALNYTGTKSKISQPLCIDFVRL